MSSKYAKESRSWNFFRRFSKTLGDGREWAVQIEQLHIKHLA
jgi:hypothetical protein